MGGLVELRIDTERMEHQQVFQAHQVTGKVVQSHAEVAAVVGLERGAGAAVLDADQREFADCGAEAERAVAHRVVAEVARGAVRVQRAADSDEDTHVAQCQRHGIGVPRGPARQQGAPDLSEGDVEAALGHQHTAQHVQRYGAVHRQVHAGGQIAQSCGVQRGLGGTQVHARVAKAAPVQFGHGRRTVSVCGLVQDGIDTKSMEHQQVFQAHQVAGEVVQCHTQVAAVVGLERGAGAAVLDADQRELAHRGAEAQRAVAHRVVAEIGWRAVGVQRATHPDEHADVAQGQGHRVGVFLIAAGQCGTADLAESNLEGALGHQHTIEHIERHRAIHRQIDTRGQRAEAGGIQRGPGGADVHAGAGERAPVELADKRRSVTMRGLVQHGVDTEGVEHQQVFQAHQVAGEVVESHAEVGAVVGLEGGTGAAVLDADQRELAHRGAEAQSAIDYRVVAEVSGCAVGAERAADPDENADIAQRQGHHVCLFRRPAGQQRAFHLTQRDGEFTLGHEYAVLDVQGHPAGYRQVHTGRQGAQAGSTQGQLLRAQVHARGTQGAPVQLAHRHHRSAAARLVEKRIDVVGVEDQQIVQPHQVAVEVVHGDSQVTAVIGRRRGVGAGVLDAHHRELANRRAKPERAVDHGRSTGRCGQAAARADEDGSVVQCQ